MKTQLMLQIALRYPQLYTLVWAPSNPAQAKKNKACRKIIEFAVINLPWMINPEAATWAVPALKFCFLLLKYLQKEPNN